MDLADARQNAPPVEDICKILEAHVCKNEMVQFAQYNTDDADTDVFEMHFAPDEPVATAKHHWNVS